VKIESLTWVKDRFLRLGEVWLCRAGGLQKFAILSARKMGAEWLLRLSGIDSPEAAKPWHGAFLCVPDGDVVRPEGGWIAADLPAMRVVDESGEELGTGASLEELPAGEAILCRSKDGHEIFLPLAGEFRCHVDAAARLIRTPRALWDVLLP
jgi:ribosomal 30S subunit maturation factor RimM